MIHGVLSRIIRRHGGDILASPRMAAEKRFMQHGTVSCYEHSLRVAEKSVAIAGHMPFPVNERALVRGALLHDYFLYDWHEKDKSHRWHGFHHAGCALENATRDFSLSLLERDIIKKHMFPLNLCLPRYRESWIVCLADKCCAIEEIFARKPGAGRGNGKGKKKC